MSDKLGLQVDAQTIASALSGLLGDGQGNIDLAGPASKMVSSGELGDIVSSWLGDGANTGISADTILGLLGEGKLADFASSVGTDTNSAATGLAHFAWAVSDIASIVERLAAAGCEPSHAGAENPHRRNVYFIDPHGFEVEFVEYGSDVPAEWNKDLH